MEMTVSSPIAGSDRTVLVVDDDRVFRARLAHAMEARGFEVYTADSASEGLRLAVDRRPAFAIVDLRARPRTY